MEVDTTATLFNFYAWLHANRKRVAAGAVVVLILAATATLWVWHSNQLEADANQALLSVPMLANISGSEDSTRRDALVKITQDYPGTIAGANAQLLAAKALFLQGKYPEAEQEFTKFITDHSGNDLIPQAKVGIAASLEAQGKLNEAVAKYKEVTATYSSDANIVLPVKLTLGRLSEALNKPDAAVTYYEELARIYNPNYPNDPNNLWAGEAGERLRLLFASHPELNPSAPQKPSTSGLLAPTEAETQISPPSTNAEAAPKPAETPKPSQNPPIFQMPTNLPPAGKQ